jgi:hypothetical protein
MKPEKRKGRGVALTMVQEVYLRELSREEFRVIERLYHRTTDATIRTCCHILLLSAQHYSIHQIVQLLFLSVDTVVRCIDDFNRVGLDAILTLPRFYGVGVFGRDYSLEGEDVWRLRAQAARLEQQMKR